MNKGGRPRDPIWEYFAEVDNDGKMEALCKKCGHRQSVKVYRMKEHLKVCNKSESSEIAVKEEISHPAVPNELGEAMLPPSKSGAQHSISEEGQEPQEASESESVKKRKRQLDMGHFVYKTSSEAKQQLDIAISRFFFGCNIPFSVAEHELFKNMITALRPGYQPPSRKALANNLLDCVSGDLEKDMKKELQGKVVTLVEDGWSNVHNDPVTATCVHVTGKSFFMKATDNGSQKKTAQYCKNQCSATITEIQQKYGCTVRSIVTDNEKKMQKMKSLLLEDDNQLLVYGCSSHWLNLLGQELTPAPIMKHIVEVQKYFRNHHQPCGWLKEVSDTVIPQLPGKAN